MGLHTNLNPEPLGTASPGVALDFSRGDHVHEMPVAGEIPVSALGSPSVVTKIQEALNLAWSAGSISGFDLTDNGDGTVDIAAGEAMLRTSASSTAPLVSLTVGATSGLVLTDNSINYIYVDHNAGVPQVSVGTSVNDFNCLDKCILYVAVRLGTQVDYAHAGEQNVDGNRKHRRLLLERGGFEHVAGGSVVSEIGTRNLASTAGAFYYGLERIDHSAFDTSGSDVFAAYHRDGAGGWVTLADQKAVDNLNYDDGSGALAPLSDYKFGAHYVYLINNTPSRLAVQYGQGDYTSIEEALAAGIPPAPPVIDGLGVLLAKVVIQKDGTIFASLVNLADSTGERTATEHNGLAGLQGGTISGTASEYYHLTYFELLKLEAIEDGATADQTGTEIKGLYEAEPDTNAFTDADALKLFNIEAGATANSTDAELRDRSTHTGTQLLATISDAGTAASKDAGTADTELPSNADIAAKNWVWGADHDFGDHVVARPELKDYAETKTAPLISSGALTLDLVNGNVFEVALTENVTGLTLANPPVSGKAGSFTLILKQDATGGRTFAWPASVKWADGTAPTLTTTANAIDILTFLTTDGGTTWYGFLGGANFS